MRYAVTITHKNGDVLYLRRTPRDTPNYRRRNVWADTHPKWDWLRANALTWANRATAEKWAAKLQERADRQDENHYKSKVGDTVVTVVEVPDASTRSNAGAHDG